MLTTFTVFSCPPGTGWWALRQMSSARPLLRGAAGLRFWRLLGTGRRFGDVTPDLRRHALLGVWDDEAAAEAFLRDSAYVAGWRARAARRVTSFLRTLGSTGAWDGERPFGASTGKPATGPVAVLTRATVRPTTVARPVALACTLSVPSPNSSVIPTPASLPGRPI